MVVGGGGLPSAKWAGCAVVTTAIPAFLSGLARRRGVIQTIVQHGTGPIRVDQRQLGVSLCASQNLCSSAHRQCTCLRTQRLACLSVHGLHISPLVGWEETFLIDSYFLVVGIKVGIYGTGRSEPQGHNTTKSRAYLRRLVRYKEIELAIAVARVVVLLHTTKYLREVYFKATAKPRLGCMRQSAQEMPNARQTCTNSSLYTVPLRFSSLSTIAPCMGMCIGMQKTSVQTGVLELKSCYYGPKVVTFM